jgi:hypothetical protein
LGSSASSTQSFRIEEALGFVSTLQIVNSHVRQNVEKSPEAYALASVAAGLEIEPN